MRPPATLRFLIVTLAACGGERPPLAVPVAAIGGFDRPESVRYDPDQDVFFVGNMAGDADSLDNNGFISRIKADGTVEQMRFVAGGANGVTLHSPRGMVLHGDTLWVVDADALRGFHRVSGAPLAMVDFRALDPAFLNDVTVGGDGLLYVTDTPHPRIFRIQNGRAEVATAAEGLNGPNGITWDQTGGRFLVAPYFEGHRLLAWRSGEEPRGLSRGTGGSYDGVEILGTDSVLAASQDDSSLQLFTAGRGRPWLRLRGEPADIGVDTKRRIVAVPYVERDTVELFRFP